MKRCFLFFFSVFTAHTSKHEDTKTHTYINKKKTYVPFSQSNYPLPHAHVNVYERLWIIYSFLFTFHTTSLPLLSYFLLFFFSLSLLLPLFLFRSFALLLLLLLL
ncbi:hypothetical protein, unlikely [Trypanosoma brucei gambiense DAL972]|uniref:Uncharacterized protein n=1 Tax=Trypanosoma brucei gambiense (strain MHOM/CI/86/DAL972) TaxID=679716 RepID=C9ZNQ5_TRYB9|nr:hypothetical protein, unlikely [Trypanosoma brucei gambiense DAL972]CBH11033.1 hypothetical protein, unlikely [Trypanosoma brucei gambiense DAL972]|eukprot:XP_011773320.1 hypothetical protein, unlikely [Trypanosoma brucei gambiense DAL972]